MVNTHVVHIFNPRHECGDSRKTYLYKNATYGSISPQLAEKTGFTAEDAEKIKEALVTLFENDESSARPAGSMEVLDVVWFTHNSKSGQYSSAKVHRSVSVNVDGTVTVNGSSIPDLRYEVIEGR